MGGPGAADGGFDMDKDPDAWRGQRRAVEIKQAMDMGLAG